MRNLLRQTKPITLLAIHPEGSRDLFRVYRDYLIFINLTRELVQSHQHAIFGFCWLRNEAWLLIRPATDNLFAQIISLLKRYYLWLKQHDQTTRQFQLRHKALCTTEQMLDALRYIHQRPTTTGIVADALDYHWHSYPVYNQFWQLDWLDSRELLGYFSSNQILAMNAFRQHMQRRGEYDYESQLRHAEFDETADYEVLNQQVWQQCLAEPDHPYLTELRQLQISLAPISGGFELAFKPPN